MQIVNTLIHSIFKSRRLHSVQMANPKTVTMQYMDLFSHLTAQLPVWGTKWCLQRHGNTFATIRNEEKDMCFILPSVALSQKHVFAVCSPAPFFCMMIQLTVDNVININKLLWTCFHRGLKAVWVWLLMAVRSEHIPMYLKGFPSLLSCPRHSSTTLLVHWFTLGCW